MTRGDNRLPLAHKEQPTMAPRELQPVVIEDEKLIVVEGAAYNGPP